MLLLLLLLLLPLVVAVAVPGSLPKRRPWRGKTRRAAHMDVRRSRQGQDAPSANPRHGRGPGARSAEGARQGALSFGYFSLREQRKVTRRKAKALLLLEAWVSDGRNCRSGFSRDSRDSRDQHDGTSLSRLKPLLQRATSQSNRATAEQELPLARVTFLCLCKEK
jgi:hypothetical protein